MGRTLRVVPEWSVRLLVDAILQRSTESMYAHSHRTVTPNGSLDAFSTSATNGNGNNGTNGTNSTNSTVLERARDAFLTQIRFDRGTYVGMRIQG